MKLNKFHGFLILMLCWFLFSMKMDIASLMVGVAASITVIFVSWEFVADKDTVDIPKPGILLKYVFILIVHIYRDSFIHMGRIVTGRSMPYIVEIEMPTHDPIILTMIANYITLTPGTITVDVEKNILYVLDIEGEEAGYETKKTVLEIYEKIFCQEDPC